MSVFMDSAVAGQRRQGHRMGQLLAAPSPRASRPVARLVGSSRFRRQGLHFFTKIVTAVTAILPVHPSNAGRAN